MTEERDQKIAEIRQYVNQVIPHGTLGRKHYDWLLSELAEALERKKALQKDLDQVDEILIVNWVGPRVDGDYRKALHDLITSSIAIENDPRVSSTAKARQDELNELREREKRLSEALQDAFDYYMGPHACGDFTCNCQSCGTCEMRASTAAALAKETPDAGV